MSLVRRNKRLDDAKELAARLKQRLVIQKPEHTADSTGGSTIVWTNVATVWGEVKSAGSGSEIFFSAQMQERKRHIITMRYRDDVDATMRIVLGLRSFNIRRIDNVDEADIVLAISAEEGVAL